MRYSFLTLIIPVICVTVYLTSDINTRLNNPEQMTPVPLQFNDSSWQYFLQHLPTADKPILDYRGVVIGNQEKHFSVLTYDVGTADLQQCADALMRIRAEYLFARKKYASIGFHFNSGQRYSWSAYLEGVRPVLNRGKLAFKHSSRTTTPSHTALRDYLNYVYEYANTVSLCRELLPADHFESGTVIIFPGSPGHCMMITDVAVSNPTDTLYKLVEGYMPAQSIYVLSNPYEPQLNPWYHLKKGEINTASCTFRSYFLRKFQ